jgi:hypothetical protein
MMGESGRASERERASTQKRMRGVVGGLFKTTGEGPAAEGEIFCGFMRERERDCTGERDDKEDPEYGF